MYNLFTKFINIIMLICTMISCVFISNKIILNLRIYTIRSYLNKQIQQTNKVHILPFFKNTQYIQIDANLKVYIDIENKIFIYYYNNKEIYRETYNKYITQIPFLS